MKYFCTGNTDEKYAIGNGDGVGNSLTLNKPTSILRFSVV